MQRTFESHYEERTSTAASRFETTNYALELSFTLWVSAGVTQACYQTVTSSNYPSVIGVNELSFHLAVCDDRTEASG